ncbi:MAG: M1 family peptidase, partial [Steroidobacterales bacterium]
MQRLLQVLLAGLSASTLVHAQGAPVGPLPREVTPTHYRLRLTIDPRKADFSGETTIEVAVHHATRLIWLHGMGLKVSAVSVTVGRRQIPARYEEVAHEFGVARVTTGTSIPAGNATLHFHYSAPFQETGQGLYHTQIANEWYAFTQFAAIDARRAFPGFDEPGFKTPFDLTLITPQRDRVVTNTPEVRGVRLKDRVVQHEFQTTRPLPTYLLAFVAGPVDIVELPPIPPNAARATPLPLR